MSGGARLDPLVEEAIEWMVRQQSGEMTPDEQQALACWRGASALHEQVFQQLASGLQQVQASPWRERSGQQLLQAVSAPSSRRHFLRGSAGVLGVLLGVGLIGRLSNAGLVLPGDIYTGTAERRSWTLGDGSQLDLNARSAVTPYLDERQRRLRLRHGELLITVAQDLHRPFQIETGQGWIQASAGKLLVREEAQGVRLATLDAVAQLSPRGGRTYSIEPRKSVLFDRRGVLVSDPVRAEQTAWLDGWLEVHNQPLAWVIEAIRPYRRGILRLDPVAGDVRVNGRYPLDDSQQTLELLENSLPISIARHSEYWVSITLKG